MWSRSRRGGRRWNLVSAGSLSLLALGACTPRSTGAVAGATASSTSASAKASSGPAAPVVAGVAYVFVFIGDGMGTAQVALGRGVRAARAGVAETPYSFERFPVRASLSTHSADAPVTDSAAAGTALAAGYKTKNGFLGVAADGVTPLESIASRAHQRGLRVGLLSSVSLDHATPAAFYAHRAGRGDYAAIAQDLLASGFDFFGGGGLAAAPESAGTRADGIWSALAGRGYTVVRGAGERPSVNRLPAFVAAPSLDAQSAMPYELDRQEGAPRLADLTRQALELFGTERGFFLMVEGGKIDWACHGNDAATAAAETEELARSIEVAEGFAARHPAQTLILVTADHETGGLAMESGRPGGALAVLLRQRGSAAALSLEVDRALRERPRAQLSDLAPLLERAVGAPLEPELTDALARGLAASQRRRTALGWVGHVYQGEPLVQAAIAANADRAGIRWSTTNHTANPVDLYVTGNGAERFRGVRDNADVGRRLVELADQLVARP